MPSILLPVSGAQVELADHARLTAKEFHRWMLADHAFDLPVQLGFMRRFITSWTLEAPLTEDAIGDLDLGDFRQIEREMTALIQRTYSEKN